MTSELDSLFDTLSLNAQGSERGGSSDSDSTGSLLSYSSGSDITHSFLTGGSGRGSPKLEVFQGKKEIEFPIFSSN